MDLLKVRHEVRYRLLEWGVFRLCPSVLGGCFYRLVEGRRDACVVVFAHAGFFNRMRAILLGWCVARHRGAGLFVRWPLNEQCDMGIAAGYSTAVPISARSLGQQLSGQCGNVRIPHLSQYRDPLQWLSTRSYLEFLKDMKIDQHWEMRLSDQAPWGSGLLCVHYRQGDFARIYGDGGDYLRNARRLIERMPWPYERICICSDGSLEEEVMRQLNVHSGTVVLNHIAGATEARSSSEQLRVDFLRLIGGHALICDARSSLGQFACRAWLAKNGSSKVESCVLGHVMAVWLS